MHMTPLSALFVFFAVCLLMLALLGHAAKANSAAPSQVTNNLSPICWTGVVMFALLALAASAS